MKRNAFASFPGICLWVCLLLFSVPQLLSAQEDSARMVRDSVPLSPVLDEPLSAPLSFAPEQITPAAVLRMGQSASLPRFSLNNPLYLPYYTNPSPLFKGDYDTGGVMRQFSHGALLASGGQTTLPGIGRFNEASLGYRHDFSPNLSLQLGVDAMKVNMMHAAGQAFSTSGTLLYRPSDRVSLQVFGSYAPGNTYGMKTHQYGASISMDMSERFGVEVGVRRYYNSMSGQWETVPIVVPYYNFDNFKLGLDVGGILYEVLRNVVFRDKMNSGGPTLAPPRLQLPPLR